MDPSAAFITFIVIIAVLYWLVGRNPAFSSIFSATSRTVSASDENRLHLRTFLKAVKHPVSPCTSNKFSDLCVSAGNGFMTRT